MGFSKEDSESDTYVCADCIGDFIVKAEIEFSGRRRCCTYCQETGWAVAIEEVANRVDDVYQVLVGEAETMPYFPSDSDKVEDRQNGSTPSEIITEMLESGYDDISTDIVGILSSRHSYRAMKDGDTDRFNDSNDIFEIVIPKSREFTETWASFCSSIKHYRRFFNDTASDELAEILGPILDADAPPDRSAVHAIAPDSKERFVYRGRMANEESVRNQILRAPINELGVSPPALNASGRMNVAGIPVFYGSFDVKTCVAELRGPVGGTAIVGKFEIIRPLRILDLTKLKNTMFNVSYFDEDVIRKFAYNRFLRGFHQEIKKSVIPGSETLDYLPTQFVAEYLWAKVDPPLDGLIFGSAQISEPDARNIALFPHAAGVEGRAEELQPKSEPKESERTKMAEESEAISAENIFEEPEFDPWQYLNADPRDAFEPALRLIAEEIVIADVKSIQYEIHARSLDMYENEFRYYKPGEDDHDDVEE